MSAPKFAVGADNAPLERLAREPRDVPRKFTNHARTGAAPHQHTRRYVNAVEERAISGRRPCAPRHGHDPWRPCCSTMGAGGSFEYGRIDASPRHEPSSRRRVDGRVEAAWP